MFNNKNIILCGFMACGKTTIGKELAYLLNMPFIDIDEEVEKSTGLSIKEIFNKFGEDHFRRIESEVIQNIKSPPVSVIATGGGSVLFEHNLKHLKKDGVIVMLDIPFATAKERILKGESCQRPLSTDMEEMFKKRLKIYISVSDIIINARTTPNMVCKNTVKILEKYR